MLECPDPTLFRLLLARQLEPSQVTTLEAHLQSCQGCQQMLQLLLGHTAVTSPSDVVVPAEQSEKTLVQPPPPADPVGNALHGVPGPDSFLGRLINPLEPLTATVAPPLRLTPEDCFPSSGVSAWLSASDAPAVPELPRPEVPGYELLNELGRGGMGVVYQALDVRLKRRVALKMVLGGGHADPAAMDRFRAEAEAVARLTHPNVVQIYEVGECHGLPYLALEYLPGGSLLGRLAREAQTPQESAQLVQTLARAVQHAHEHGIIHRDLKPANVLLTADGQPKITDFGLAKLVDSVDARTRAGDIVGTPGYLAPEQAAGDPAAIGPGADIYALGVILYEMLTGRPPFQAPNPLDTVMLVRLQDPIPPRRLQPKLARDLETICLKCLEKEPRRRYISAVALADDLKRWLEGQPIQARPAGGGERLLKWARRQPVLAALTFCTFLAVVLGFAGVGLALHQAQERAEVEYRAHVFSERVQETTEKQRQQAVRQQQQADAERHRAEVRTVRGFLERGVSLCEMGDVSRGLVLLAQALKLTEEVRTLPLGSRDEKDAEAQLAYLDRLEWLIRLNLAGWHPRLAIRLRARLPHANWVWDVAFSPDGKLAATACRDGFARLWDAETGAPVAELPCGNAVWAVRFSPDGSRLLTAAYTDSEARKAGKPVRGEVQLWDVASAPVRTHAGVQKVGSAMPFQLVGTEVVGFSTAFFSPDGKAVLVQTSPATLGFFDAATGRPRGPPLRLRDWFLLAVPSPDGQTVVVGGRDGSVRRLSVATGLPVGPEFRHNGPVSALACSPDGRLLLSGAWLIDRERQRYSGGEVRLWDVETGEQVGFALPQPDSVKVVAFSPDGRTCLTGGILWGNFQKDQWKGWVRLWDARTGQPLGPVQQVRAPVWSAAFSGDGTRVVTGCEDGVGRVWCVQTGKELGPQPHTYVPTGNVRAAALHPSGRTFLLGSTTNPTSAFLLDVGPPPLARMPLLAPQPPDGEPQGIGALAFGPDGRTLLTGGDDGKVRFWATETGRLLPRSVQLPEGMIVRQFGPDGRTCLAANGLPKDAWRGELWDLDTGKVVKRLALDDRFTAAAFSPDGRHLALSTHAGPGRARMFRTAGLTLEKELQGGPPVPITSLAFGPDGQQLLAAQNNPGHRAPWLWDVQTGQVLRKFPTQPLPVHHLACDRQGRMLVGLDLGEVRLWEWQGETARPLSVQLLHRAAVASLGFSPDGRMALTACGSQVLLWDPLTGLRLGPPLEQDAPLRATAFHPEGRLIATAGENKQVRLWPAPAPLKGSAAQVQCWVEAITRQRLELQPTEAILPLEDDEVGKRYLRLRTELGGSPE